ncbi:MAG TPA: hypothetical protein VEF04_22740, partial [Blastocatellia bacterium]|nr:hypothetical protein [Blastocatellia bacterium]
RFLPTVHPIWVILALAFNPFIIWAATEIRVYALVLLLSSLLLQYFDDGYLGESSRRSHLVHAGLALVSLYTYYYLGFLLLAQAGALVLLRRWRSLWTYCLMMVAVGVGFTPMLVYIPQQTQGYTSALTQQPSLSTALRLLSWRLQEQLLPAYWPPTIAIARIIIAGLALLACGLLIGQVRQRIASSHIAMWTILVITMCCSLAAYLATAEAFLESRHTTIFLIPLTLSVFALLITTIRKQGVFIWAITVLAFSVASDAALYSHPAKTGDWARVAAYLKATERQGQPILVSQALSAVPLSYYYSGVNQLVPVPRPEDFRKFNSPDLVLKDERQLAELLAQTGSGGEVFWLVTDEMCELLGRDLNCHVLENFISKNYVVEQSQDFFRSRARLLRRKTPTQTAPSAN